jgi:NTP pyrophosphatase (non-canonical NTP hydrolase)
MNTPQSQEEFVNAWRDIQSDVFTTNVEKGWWEDRDQIMETNPCSGPVQVKLAAIMLMVTELSEAVENIRHGEGPDDKINQFTGLEAELADTVIRIMDLACRFNLKVPEAIVAKKNYNQQREYRHGGKKA